MSSPAADPPVAETRDAPRGSTLGLPQATALIVGSIIGVGVFNLPGSLSAYGPISAGVDGAGHRRCAGSGRAVRRPVQTAARRRGPVRILARGVRERRRLHERVVVLDHRVGRQRGDSDRLGALRGVPVHRGRGEPATAQRRAHCHRADRPVDPGAGQPERRVQRRGGPGRHHRAEVRRPGVGLRRGSVLHRHRQLSRRGTSQAGRTSPRSAPGMAICLFSYLGVETAAVAAAQGAQPRPQRAAGHHPRDAGKRRGVPALVGRRVRHRAQPATWRRTPTGVVLHRGEHDRSAAAGRATCVALAPSSSPASAP